MLSLSKLRSGDHVKLRDGTVATVDQVNIRTGVNYPNAYKYWLTYAHAEDTIRYYAEDGQHIANRDIDILKIVTLEENGAPEGQEVSATGFKKWDKGKAPLNYLLDVPLINDEVAFIRQFGDQKYGRLNWKLSDDPERYIAAALRHIQLNGDQELLDDDESGRPHLAHAICCLQFFAEIKLEQKKAKKNETTQDN